MGKKRTQKTKELSVAIAEASSKGEEQREEEEEEQQAPSSTPRKRGRPRKVINERIDEAGEEKRVAETPAGVEHRVLVTSADERKLDEAAKSSRYGMEEEKASVMSMRGKKKEEREKEEEEERESGLRRSRRKKSKPIKSI